MVAEQDDDDVLLLEVQVEREGANKGADGTARELN